MNRARATATVILAFVFGLGFTTSLHAGTFSTLAFDNATVQPGGPRHTDPPPDYGKIFFNMEGYSNGAFSSFAVADFDSTMLGIGFTVTQINSLSIVLTQDNAAFTTDGPINFYLSEDTTTSIQFDAPSPIMFDYPPDSQGVDGQLQPLHALGSGSFMQTATGDPDTYNLTLDDAGTQYLINQINSGGVIRIVITPGSPDVSATYAGYSNDMYAGPVIAVGASGG